MSPTARIIVGAVLGALIVLKAVVMISAVRVHRQLRDAEERLAERGRRRST